MTTDHRTDDWHACTDAVIAFCDFTDARDMDGQLSVFTDDAVMAPFPGMTISGKDQIRGVFERMAHMPMRQRHVVTNLRVRFTGDDTAEVRALLSIYHFTDDAAPLTPAMMINETNDLRRVGGTWLIAAKRGERVAGLAMGGPHP
jgi:uncharacterized protein (TIGR02246 family)